MKIAHIVVITPNRCGLYETTRELVASLRKTNVDSRMYDPTKSTNKLYPKGIIDRGAVFCDLKWVENADVIVNHSGLGEELEKLNKPIIHVAHGRPHSSFITEVKGGTPIYSYHYHKSKDSRFKSIVTFWPQHKPYLEVMWPNTPVKVIPAPVDLREWSPHGPDGYKFHGMGGDINIVCTDAWREDIDPFVVVNAFALFARKIKAKLHIYGNSKELRGWSALFKQIQDDGNLGEVGGWVKGLGNVYRAADMLITPHTIDVRSKREAMACGCPVLSGNDLTRNNDLYEFADKMVEFFEMPLEKRRAYRIEMREKAKELFNPENTAKVFLETVEEVLWPQETQNGPQRKTLHGV